MKNLLITVFFLSLTLQLSAETGGSNPVIVEKTTASLAEKTPVYWQKMADGMSQALIKHFWGQQTSKGMKIGFILIMVVTFPI